MRRPISLVGLRPSHQAMFQPQVLSLNKALGGALRRLVCSKGSWAIICAERLFFRQDLAGK
jgi:hypothetical protein